MIRFWQIGMQAETHIHVGEGQNRGAIDQPVAREHVTRYPYIPGSALKGALRADFNPMGDTADHALKSEEGHLFGHVNYGAESIGGDTQNLDIPTEDGLRETAGALIIQDARLVALPVRSNTSPFRYVTSPALIARLNKHRRLSGVRSEISSPIPEPDHCIEYDPLNRESCAGAVLLEDLTLDRVDTQHSEMTELATAVFALIGLQKPNAPLTVVPDDVFRWLMEHALPVRARNSLDRQYKTVMDGALWYEETLPPETVMSTLWGARNFKKDGEDPFNKLWDGLSQNDAAYLQVGANETVGQGWFALTKHRGES